MNKCRCRSPIKKNPVLMILKKLYCRNLSPTFRALAEREATPSARPTQRRISTSRAKPAQSATRTQVFRGGKERGKYWPPSPVGSMTTVRAGAEKQQLAASRSMAGRLPVEPSACVQHGCPTPTAHRLLALQSSQSPGLTLYTRQKNLGHP